MSKKMYAGYPSVSDAGFQHCALIYENPRREPDVFRPLVAKVVDGKAEPQWGFDAFLFLIHNVRLMNTEIGSLNMADYQLILETYFNPGRYIDALNTAVEDVAAEVGELPPSKRKVIIAIPWMNPAVTDFGDVDGDGVIESLATAEGRDKVIFWFVDQVKKRFANCYPMLELWGFYWMRENVSDTPEVVKAAAKIIHNADLKLLWIPYYLAKGFDRWQEYDIDVAIMQSNYTFTGYELGGNVRSNRLYANADRCKQHKLGFEIEQISSTNLSPQRRYFLLKTLELGHAAQLGYQHVPTAYYLGGTLECATSADPEMRNIYYTYCDYLAGKAVKVPRPDHWQITRNSDTLQAVCQFPAMQEVANVDIFFNEDPLCASPWHGIATLRGKVNGEWQCLGWAVRATTQVDELQYQALTIPVGKLCTELELSLTATQHLDLTDIAIECSGKPMDMTTHCAAPANDFPALAAAIDSGKLAAFHAWHGQTEIVRAYQPAHSVTADEIRVKILKPALHDLDFQWNSSLLLTPAQDFCGTNGTGELPNGTQIVGVSSLVRHSEHLGELIFKLNAPTAVSRFAIASRINGYSGLGQVTLLLNNQPVTLPITSIGHGGTVNPGGLYYDDGVVASTGVIARELNGMVSWIGTEEREFTIELPQMRTGDKIALECYYAKLQNVYLPARVEFAYSTDGRNWSQFVPAFIPAASENRNMLRPVWCTAKLNAMTEIKQIKVKATGSGNGMVLLKQLKIW